MNRGQKRSRDQAYVADHYNNVKSLGHKGRKNSSVAQLRMLNNWVKATLIQTYTRKGDTVFDMCGGKGGDLGKWTHARVKEVVLADHALESIKNARDRFNKARKPMPFPLQLVCADLTSKNIFEEETLDGELDDVWFDVVSCQFAFHYCFETEARTRMMLENVSTRLKPGGWWIGTTTDANVLVKKWRHLGTGVSDPRLGPEAEKNHTFGNQWYKVRFVIEGEDGSPDPMLVQKKLSADTPFGNRYFFTLQDSVNDCPEFLVSFPVLERLAKEYDLELKKSENFHEYFLNNFDLRGNRKLLDRMRVLNKDGRIEKDQWEIAYLYKVFVFRKKADSSVRPHGVERRASRKFPLEEEDILVFPEEDGC